MAREGRYMFGLFGKKKVAGNGKKQTEMSPIDRQTMKGDEVLTQQMIEVADFFTGTLRCERDVIFAERLQRKRLDYTQDSLHAVDEWLQILQDLGMAHVNEANSETVLWAGAYVGEVIRRHGNRKYRWMRYEDYMTSQEERLRQAIPFTFGTQFLLVSEEKAMTMPINKVVRRIEEGPENNIHFYSLGYCQEASSVGFKSSVFDRNNISTR